MSRPCCRGFDAQPTRGNYGIGILRSIDGGKTWTPSLAWQPRDQTGVQDLAIVPGVTHGNGILAAPASQEPARSFEMKLERAGGTNWPAAGAVSPK